MSSRASSPSGDDVPPTPFLLQLFHKTGGFHRLEEFGQRSLPSHVPVHVGMDCTLEELVLELADTQPSAIPKPATGTRVSFQLVYPDLRSPDHYGPPSPRFGVKDLGSVVIGAGGPGAEMSAAEESAAQRDGAKTLSDAKFIVGDYVSCAILPPLSDGSVAPASTAKRESAPGTIGGRGGRRGDFGPREGTFGRGGGRGGGVRGGRQGWKDSSADGFPSGEWKRGEQLPGASRGRGKPRW